MTTRTPATQRSTTFNQHLPARQQELLDFYGELRGQCPMAWSDEHGGFWIVTRFADVRTVLRENDRYLSDRDPETDKGGLFIPPRPDRPLLIGETAEAEHRRARTLANPLFSRATIDAARPMITRHVDQAIDEVLERGSFDLIAEFAAAIPARVTLEYIGMEPESWRVWSEPLRAEIYSPVGSPAHQQAHARMVENHKLMWQVIRDRQAQPTGDVISQLATGEIGGRPLEDSTVSALVHGLIFGGLETTGNLLAHILLLLQRQPELRERLLADRTMMVPAVEEWLRYFSPAQTLVRRAGEPMELGGVQLEPDDQLLLSIASANRDDNQFTDPNSVDLTRTPNRHLAFGIGEHFCIGAPLARAELEIAVGAVLDRLPKLWIDDAQSVPYPLPGFVNGWVAMPALADADAVSV